MIPLAVPDLTGNERKYLNECIDTTFVSSVGEFVNRLEEDAARATGATAAVATSAGTTALHASLVVVGVRPGDLVIVPSFTFIASANSIRHAGADPWLFDIDPSSWCIDLNQVRRELDSCCEVRNGICWHKATGRRVSAMMPVYTLGATPDMDEARAICDRWGLALVADAACAIGVTYRGREVASLADLSCISLNGNKTVTAGGGGLIVGREEGQLADARHLTTTARVWPDYDFDRVGYNYRLTNLQAAVAVAQLERLGDFLTRKCEVRARYEAELCTLPGVTGFPSPDWCDCTCWFSGVVASDAEHASKLVSDLNEQGIGAKGFWKPVHLQLPYRACERSGSLAVTESIWSRVVTLPCSVGITDAEVDEVVNKTRRLLG